MSVLGDLASELVKDVALSPAGATAEPQIAGIKKQDNIAEEINEKNDIEEDAGTGSVLLQLSTEPLGEDKRKDEGASEPDEGDTGISEEGQDLSVEQSQHESIEKSKAKWRESMPEGERWRDEEIEVQQDNKRANSLANDEEEVEESNWISEKTALVFTPQVTIVRPSSKELPVASWHASEKDIEKEPQVEPDTAVQVYQEWSEEDQTYCEYDCTWAKLDRWNCQTDE